MKRAEAMAGNKGLLYWAVALAMALCLSSWLLSSASVSARWPELSAAYHAQPVRVTIALAMPLTMVSVIALGLVRIVALLLFLGLGVILLKAGVTRRQLNKIAILLGLVSAEQIIDPEDRP